MDLQKARLENIDTNIEHSLKLLADYEKSLLLTSDPKERMKFQGQIDYLKSSLALAEAERDTLLSRPKPLSPVVFPVSNLPKVVLTQDGREMVLIPAGQFLFGTGHEEIELPAFYMDRYPVTNQDYQYYLDASQRPAPFHWPNGALPQGKRQHPVVNLTYSEALSYAQAKNKRLPTEQEWEKATRGIDGRLWPWGNTFDEQLCYDGWKLPLKERSTLPVGNFSPRGDSPYGVGDIGHLWEWTASWYSEGIYKVVRGGPWRNVQWLPATVNRSYVRDRDPDLGFRCACDARNIKDILVSVLKQ